MLTLVDGLGGKEDDNEADDEVVLKRGLFVRERGPVGGVAPNREELASGDDEESVEDDEEGRG